MSRNGSGTYSVPNTFVSQATISSAEHNENMSDIGAEITNSVAADGQTSMTGPLKASAGSVASPSLTFASDTDTGVYRIGANNLGVAVAGTKILDVDANGLDVVGDLTVSDDAAITGDLTAATVTATTGTIEDLTVSDDLTVVGDINGALANFSGVVSMTATSHFIPPIGTTAQRTGSPTTGMQRFNSTLGFPEFYSGAAWTNFSLAQPISGGFRALSISNNVSSPTTTMDLTATAVIVETSGGVAYRLQNVSVSINVSSSGANGLDTGSVANSTWYYLYVIYNPSTGTVAGLASTSATSPTLPSGYTAYSRFGANVTDGSALLKRIIQKGKRVQYAFTSGTNTTVASLSLYSGSSGNVVTPTWTTVSVSSVVPPTASTIIGNIGSNSGAIVILAPNNSYGGTGSAAGGAFVHANAATTAIPFEMMLESNNIYYAASGAASSVNIVGWTDNI